MSNPRYLTNPYRLKIMIARTSILSLLLLSLLGSASGFVAGGARPSFGVKSTTSSSSLYERKDADMSEEEREVALDKATKAMTAFTNTYLKNTSTKLCSDKSVPAVVIKGLAEHKVSLGAPLCPCRFYDDKEKEAKDGYWNCPCVPMRERHECHCMLFLTEDNDFAGDAEVCRF
jgi:ferredoxin-thioredoxin reductase catalytic chain